MRIVIADVASRLSGGKVTGHSLAVANNYIEMFHQEAEVKVAGGPVYGVDKRYHAVLRYNTDISLHSINKIRILKNIRQLFQEYKYDIIVLQSCSVATAFMGITLFKPRTCSLYSIQYNTEGIGSGLKRFLYSLAKRKISGIICTQDSVGRAYGQPYCVVPDYIYTGGNITETVSYEGKKYDIGMVGIISRDKGVIEAARVLAGTKYKILIVGRPLDDSIGRELEEICSIASNIEYRLDYISEEEFRDGIRNCRYCILNYSDAYSDHTSGVVYDIIFNRVPVVGRSCASLNFIEKYGLGKIYEDMEKFDFNCLFDESIYSRYLDNINKYFHLHENYKNILKSFLLKND